jgi:hypothetical protein
MNFVRNKELLQRPMRALEGEKTKPQYDPCRGFVQPKRVVLKEINFFQNMARNFRLKLISVEMPGNQKFFPPPENPSPSPRTGLTARGEEREGAALSRPRLNKKGTASKETVPFLFI